MVHGASKAFRTDKWITTFDRLNDVARFLCTVSDGSLEICLSNTVQLLSQHCFSNEEYLFHATQQEYQALAFPSSSLI